MRRQISIVSFTIVVFLFLGFGNARAEGFSVEPPDSSIRSLEHVLDQEQGDPAAQENGWLLDGEGGTQPSLLYAQWGSGGQRTVRCESQNDRYAYCPTHTGGRVRLQRQLSNAPCRQYETWGETGGGSGVWVRNGCRAIFVVGGGGGGGGGGWGGGSGRTVTCKSEHFQYNRCPVYQGRGKVRLTRQLSDASCVRGSSWGVDRDGIWVNNGCAAEFEIR
jgi:hypothetical protein